ncbi:Rho GTPase activation protein, partial [Choanephora cucurbitarum]
VFGIPLSMSIKYAKTTVGYIDEDNVRHTKAGAIPIVVAKCGSFLKKNGLSTEGIFRVPGNVRRVNTLELIFDQSTSNYGLDLSWEGYTVHDAASLLRRYLNKLPDPVIPFEFYREFRDVMSKTYTANESRIEALQQLIQRMPIPHQHLLLYLLDTLSLFASNASETKMTISNLAAVFCPGILRHPDENTPVQYKISQYVIEFLIEFQSLFTMQL